MLQMSNLPSVMPEECIGKVVLMWRETFIRKTFKLQIETLKMM